MKFKDNSMFSGSAWEEMLDNRQVECNCGKLWDISKDISKFSSDSQKLLADELLQVWGNLKLNILFICFLFRTFSASALSQIRRLVT